MDQSYGVMKDKFVAKFTRRYLDRLLKQTRGNVLQAARIARIDNGNFRRLLRKYEIYPDHYRVAEV